MKQLDGTFYYYKGYVVQLLPSGFCRIAEVRRSIGLNKDNGNFVDRLPKIIDKIIIEKSQAKEKQEQIVSSAVEKMTCSLLKVLETKLKEKENMEV